MALSENTVRVRRYEPRDPRLGRHFRQDSRSLRYLAPELPRTALTSKKHYSYIPVLDQGDIGSCTGNAAVKAMSYGDLYSTVTKRVLSTTDTNTNQTIAINVYSEATKLDPWPGAYPPEDTGSDGLSVAKVLFSRGWVSGYTHATTLDAVLTALQTRPVITGTAWYEGMYDVEADGRIRPTGEELGGHEYVLDEVDIENQRVWMQNSWGPHWGVNGRAYITFEDYTVLLKYYGDATVFVPLTEPTPTPTPVVNEADAADLVFATKARRWLDNNPWFYKKTIQAYIREWLAAKNL